MAHINLELPTSTYRRLEKKAKQSAKSVTELVQDLILREAADLPELSAEVEAEISSFNHLTNETLALIAQSTITSDQQQRLAELNSDAGERELSTAEKDQQAQLLEAYQRSILRRAKATAILKQRGFHIEP